LSPFPVVTKKGHLLGLKHLDKYQEQSYMVTVLIAEQKQLLKMLAGGLKSLCLPKILLHLTQAHVGMHKQNLPIIVDLLSKKKEIICLS